MIVYDKIVALCFLYLNFDFKIFSLQNFKIKIKNIKIINTSLLISKRLCLCHQVIDQRVKNKFSIQKKSH